MPAVFAQAHVVCLPSYREGMPKVLIEAASCGRPLVTTDVPGCREVARHGENGLLVPARDSGALAIALKWLLVDPDLRARLGREGRKLVEASLSLDKVVGATQEVYRTLQRSQQGWH